VFSAQVKGDLIKAWIIFCINRFKLHNNWIVVCALLSGSGLEIPMPITHTIRGFILIAVSLFALPSGVSAATKYWSSSYPLSGSVTIPAADTVILDANFNLKNLTVLGKLVCADKNLNLQSGWILVKGSWDCGSAAAPYRKQFKLTLTGNNPAENVLQMGTKFIGTMGSGALNFFGAPRTVGWTRLNATVRKGAKQIALQKNVDWKAGEQIVIASSDYRPEHAETAVITAVSGNVVKFAAPLVYDHWCKQDGYTATWQMTECAEIALLSRNIVIQGDSASVVSGFGGHMMVMAGGSAKLANVELFRMGQKGLIARYPMHWHLAGDVNGQYLMDSTIHHAYNRFVSVHGTHKLQVLRNIGYDTIGHGFYLEDGIEQNNLLAGNLGLSVRNSTDGKPTASDREASVFWISHPNNVIRNNVAAGSEHTGFWLGFPEHPIGLSTNNAIWPRRTPLAEFKGNVSHSNQGRGLYVDGGELPDRTTTTTWYEPRNNPADEKSALVKPVFSAFTAYKNRNEGIWIRSFAGPVVTGAKLADNWMGAYFANILSGPAYNNVGSFENSLVVGETGNLGNPESWETKGIGGRELPRFWSPGDSIRGIEFYDGPMAVKNTLFVNFVSNSQRKAGGLTGLAPNPYWVSSRNSSQGISFLNANRVYLHSPVVDNSGDAFSTFLDIDGSVSGKPGLMIVPKNPVLVTAQCSFTAAWNAYACPHEYINLHIYTHSGENPTGTLLRRDDGASITLYNPAQYTDQVNANLLVNRPHSLQFQNVTPRHLSFVVSEKANKAIRLSMPYPTANFTVTRWGQPVERAASLAQMASGNNHKYFYDGSRLHLRLVSQDGRWDEMEVKRP
jgi:G8 domain